MEYCRCAAAEDELERIGTRSQVWLV